VIALADYPAGEGWALAYQLSNAAGTITFTSTADGDDHLVSVAATTTANWAPGTYTWRARAVLGAEAYTVRSGTLDVVASLASAADLRSHARRALAAIEAYLESPANVAAAAYEIAGRRVQHYPVADLMRLRSRYQAEVAREDAAARVARGLPDPRRVYVRFGP